MEENNIDRPTLKSFETILKNHRDCSVIHCIDNQIGARFVVPNSWCNQCITPQSEDGSVKKRKKVLSVGNVQTCQHIGNFISNASENMKQKFWKLFGEAC